MTRALLENKCRALNVLLGLPLSAVEHDEKGKVKRGADGAVLFTIGCITVDHYQPGGNRHTWAVVMCGRGGSENVLNRHQGRMTADECNAFLSGMLAVLEDVPLYRKVKP